MTETIVDSVSIDPDASVDANIERVDPSVSSDFAFFIEGDSNSADVTVAFWVVPRNNTDETDRSNWFKKTEDEHKNVDITNGLVYHPETRSVRYVIVEITNNGTSATTVTVKVDEYSKS